MLNRTIMVAMATALTLGAVAQKREMIALAGSGVDKIAIIDKATGKQVWSHQLAHGTECNTVAVKPNGDVLFSYKQGVRMINSKGETIWDFPVEKGQEAQTASFLPDGNILVAVCAHPARLIELDAKGRKILEVNYDLGVPGEAHSQFRQVAKAANGNYLIPVISQAKVVEINAKGEKVMGWDVPATPFSIKEIAQGNLLVSTLGQLVEIDRKSGELLAVIAKGAIGDKGDTLRFSTEAVRLPGGRTMLSNWQGYAKNKDAQLIELDAQGKVVYSFRDTSIMKNISGFYLFKK